MVSKYDVPTTFNLPVGFVVPNPTEPNAAVACWKSISAFGVAELNPIGPTKLTLLNVDIPEVVKIFACNV